MRIQSEEIRLKIGVILIDEKMRESHLRLFGLFRRKQLMHW